MILNYLESLTQRRVLTWSIFFLIVFVTFRFAFGGFNFSHFVVAGSDFVVKDSLHPNLIVNEGQGYDGQFFYRYAHNPFDISKTAHGVTVDHLEYRIQRIFYPLTVWIFSMGGNPSLIPFLLVFLNFLAFVGIFYFSLKICNHFGSKPYLALLPIFLFGSYMSLSRDTSELYEVLFFVSALYFLLKNNLFLFFISVLFAIFSRETSIIAIGPLSALYGIRLIKEYKFNITTILKGLLLVLPFILIVIWKYYLKITIDSDRLVDGSHNLSLPFEGILYGAKHNFNFDSFKSIFETIFWYIFLVWNIFLAIIVTKSISFKTIFSFDDKSILSTVYVVWLMFSLILGPAIYIDDWGFVRIFGLWNMLGFVLLIMNNKNIPFLFILYSLLILGLLMIRLIIRV